jgi:hypothetical protein
MSDTSFGLKHLFLILLIIGALFLIFGLGGGEDLQPTAPAATSNLSAASYVQAKNFVSQVLKSPATADFPLFGEGFETGPNTYTVNSFVDSQNGFGAMLRSGYSITLEFTGGDKADQSNWKVVDFIFDGEDLLH